MNKYNVIYVGLSGFPNGFAMISKITLISRSLQNIGLNTLVINRKWSSSTKYEGIHSGINYISTLNRPKPAHFIMRRIYNLLLPFIEWKLINSIIKTNSINYMVVNSRSFLLLLFYVFISKIRKVKLLITYVEQGSAMVTRSRKSILNDFFFERLAFKFVDAALPISDYLTNIIRKQNDKLPILKTPVLTDIEEIDSFTVDKVENQFLFCGAAAFIEVIKFIVDSFELVDTKEVNLVLICGGTKNEIAEVKKIITISSKSNQIILKNNLPYSNLIRLYKSSLALLIPLRLTKQDEARFPHKIGEYSASGRPIISNNYGEVSKYFTNGKSAILADEYSTKEIANKMNFVINNKQKATEIGFEGKVVCHKYFDYKNYSIELQNFLKKI